MNPSLVRYVIAFLSAFAVSTLSTWVLTVVLKKGKAFVAVKPELLVKEERKSRTPFLGGISFPVTITFVMLVFGDIKDPVTIIGLAALWVFGICGLIDDLLKIKTENGDGFDVKQKFCSQIISAAMVVFLMIWLCPEVTEYFGSFFRLGYAYFIPAVVFLVYYTNAMNITDGVDGLLGTSTIPVLALLLVIAFSLGEEGRQSSLLSVSAIGTIGGFLIFNHSPAKIFMGDVGSHSLGGLIGIMALMLNKELVILVAGALFLLEFLSSLVQIVSIRVFHRKVFAIAPLHHLLEFKGYSALKIVCLFSLVSLAGCVLGFLLWKFGVC